MRTLLSLYHQSKKAFLDLLFPLRCLGCGREGGLLCPSCCRSLPQVKLPYCQCCGMPLKEGLVCLACLSYPLAINGIRSPLIFEGSVRRAIHQFKYNHLKELALPLGQLLAGFLQAHPLPGEVLIPVPLHSNRLRQRGYNQASLLAKEMGRLSGLPVSEEMLIRLRNTASQVRTAGAAERSDNVREAFVGKQRLQGEQILLIDDVCTTGATLDACARALKAAGAGPVWGLTVAREIFPFSQSSP